ncbi:MAG: hypothetical protein LR005_00245 [Candidatus Pacebacteria bacterium]|nr:hypothetical protein [Candidatus Paceibacterota bacterium]
MALALLFLFMELENLIKKREEEAGKFVKLMIEIAVIFLIPAVIAVFLSKYFNLSFLYFFPFAFIASWVMVISLYRKVSKKMKGLDKQISELREKQGQPKKHITL